MFRHVLHINGRSRNILRLAMRRDRNLTNPYRDQESRLFIVSRASSISTRENLKPSTPIKEHVDLQKPKEHGRLRHPVQRKPPFHEVGTDVPTPRRSSKRGSARTASAGHEKLVTAYSVASNYNFSNVQYLLRNRGFLIDPCHTSLSHQVIHIELTRSPALDPLVPVLDGKDTGDVFIFRSGTVVAWDVPEASVLRLVREVLWSAGEGHHNVEDEDFEYIEDTTRNRSNIQGETIVLGTGITRDEGTTTGTSSGTDPTTPDLTSHRHVDVILAKIAFSAGLARSTKLAVLESRLELYLEGTKSIPEKLMSGNLGSFSRSFIYLKMGQLLDLRRQLNLSSDITDSLPDVFWDTEADLGLENYYNRMSAALDTRQRIISLNEKISYAHEIASILREELSVIREQQNERHSSRLEWIIILLITVEVMFGSWDLYQKMQASEAGSVHIHKDE